MSFADFFIGDSPYMSLVVACLLAFYLIFFIKKLFDYFKINEKSIFNFIKKLFDYFKNKEKSNTKPQQSNKYKKVVVKVTYDETIYSYEYNDISVEIADKICKQFVKTNKNTNHREAETDDSNSCISDPNNEFDQTQFAEL